MADFDSLCSFVLPLEKDLLIDVVNFLDGCGKSILPTYQIDLKAPGIWFYTEETFDPPELAEILYEIICEFDLPPFGFEWANTCSKPQLDAFGGGAVWITKYGFQFVSTNNWLEERRAKSNVPNSGA